MPKRKKPAAPTTRFVAEPKSTSYILDTTAVLKPIACSRYDREKVLNLLNAGWEAVYARDRSAVTTGIGGVPAPGVLWEMMKNAQVLSVPSRKVGTTTPLLREARASVALDGETQSPDP